MEVVRDDLVDEVIHGKVTAKLRRRTLRLVDGDEPIAVKRVTLPDGPTRPPVILVHGFAQNRFSWRLSRRSLSGRLAAAGYDVHNLELRGHGLSRAYGSGNARHFDEYVQDVVRVAEATEPDLGPPFAIGHSLGGAIIVGAATKTPLAGIVPIAGVYTFATANRTLRWLSRLSLAAEPVLAATPIRMSTGWVGDLLGRMYSVTEMAGHLAPLAGWVPGSLERDLLEERLVKGFDWTSVEVWLQMARWATGEELAYAHAFRETDVPVLAIVGDHDPLVSRRDAENLLRDAASDDASLVEFDVYEHRSHWGHVDLILGKRAPAVVWPVLLDWLEARCP